VAGTNATTAAVAVLALASVRVVLYMTGIHGARLDTRAAADAFFLIQNGNPLTDDADVVEVGLHAVVGAAANGDLEFVGKLDAVIALII
jgi:hypothetical protein